MRHRVLVVVVAAPCPLPFLTFSCVLCGVSPLAFSIHKIAVLHDDYDNEPVARQFDLDETSGS